jgi:uncharacterized membrane protein
VSPPHREPASAGAERETARVEAFSDGVFAIAITLLILEIKVPHDTEGVPLWQALAGQWPSYLAFVASFFSIGVMWINHHKLFSLIGRCDHRLLILNGLVLFGVTVVPFPTALIAEHVRTHGAVTAVAVYNAWFIVIALVYTWLWGYASTDRRMIHRKVRDEEIQVVNNQYRFGWVSYAVILALGFWKPGLSVALNLALAIWFGLPPDWFAPRTRSGADGSSAGAG